MLSNAQAENLTPPSTPVLPMSTGTTELAPPPSTPTLKENFQSYRAYAIKLNLLADICPVGAAEQTEFDRQQNKCLKGQQAILKRCGRQSVTSHDDAIYMMKLWREDVLKGQSDADLSDSDRMINQLFLYFQDALNQG